MYEGIEAFCKAPLTEDMGVSANIEKHTKHLKDKAKKSRAAIDKPQKRLVK